MRMPTRLVPALLMAGALQGQAPDAQLATLIQEALANNPQLKASRSATEAERAKVPQAGALPDPMVTLGYQNDGFHSLSYGVAPRSFAKVEVSQAFPYPGKRKLREDIAQAGLAAVDAESQRVRLDVVSDVKRTYFDLLRVQGKQALLDSQMALWDQVALSVRAQMETGHSSTVDLLRAQLERTRLEQQKAELSGRRAALESELNRLAGRSLSSPLQVVSSLESLPLPLAPEEDAAVASAVQDSPEISEARHHLVYFQQQVDLAELDLRPDFTVGAAVMPQGPLGGMWSLSVGFNVPLWSGRKQQKAVAQARAESEVQGLQLQDLEQRLSSLTLARVAKLRADLHIAGLYENGLLAQSDAAYRASLAQFSTGSASFRQVLEALSDRLKDHSDYLDAVAQAHFDAIELERAAPGTTTNPSMNGGQP